MATQTQSQIRADKFSANKPLPVIESLVNQLRQHVEPSLMQKIEADLKDYYAGREDPRAFYCTLLRWLSRNADDKVWDASVAAIMEVSTQVRR